MRVLVTGGTGFIGAHSVAGLLEAGHSVRLLVRNPARVPRALGPLGIDMDRVEVIPGSVTDAEMVSDVLCECDAVLHTTFAYSSGSRNPSKKRHVRAGTDVVLDVAATEGVDPIVFVSGIGALVPTRRLVLTPEGDVGRPRDAYLAGMAEAERIARSYQDAGAAVVITYPGATLGPHDPRVGGQVRRLRNVLRGKLPIWPTGGFPVGDVRDVARLHAAVMEPGMGARRLIAPSRYVTTREYIEMLRTVTGRALPAMFLPAAAMWPMERTAGLVQQFVPVHIPTERGAIYACSVGKPVDTSATEKLLGGAQKYDLKRSVTDTVRWLYSRGLIDRRMAGAAVGA